MARTWDSWTGNVTGPTMSKAREVVAGAAKAGHTIRVVHGKDSNRNNTEHYSGRALDFMTFSSAALNGTDRTIGDWVADYLWKHRARLGLKWIIWRQRIRSTSSGSGGQWQGMSDRGSPTNNHMDHVHAYFDTAAYRAPDGSSSPPIGAGASPSNPTADWMDTMFKNVSEFKKAVINAAWGDRFPNPNKSLAKKNSHISGYTYLAWIYNNARQANENSAAALAIAKAGAKKSGITDADLAKVEKAAREGAHTGVDDKIGEANVTLEVKE